MSKENQLKRCFTQMVYGDALGFLWENNNENIMVFKSFRFARDQQLEMKIAAGQWSDLTELSLIIIKCLVDEKEKSKVTLDYFRLQEELKLWDYYRHGGSPNLLNRIQEGEAYYQQPLYYDDKRGYGFSRIMTILLANKNFEAAKEEILRQISYTNHHPQVIITSLLLSRITHTLLEKGNRTREELVNELKDYLITLQRDQLNTHREEEPSKKYILQFEQEKVNYLMVLDRLKSGQEGQQIPLKLDSRGVLTAALENYWRLQQEMDLDLRLTSKDDLKEALALAYGLWGINNGTEGITTEIKDGDFIESMGDYIGRIRNYEIQRKPYEGSHIEVDLFQLKVGAVIKHSTLNITKVVDRREGQRWIEVTIETKTGMYKLYRQK